MTEYVCEQLTNATYKCSEIVAESSADFATWLVIIFFACLVGYYIFACLVFLLAWWEHL